MRYKSQELKNKYVKILNINKVYFLEAKILQFLGEKEQNEYVVQNYYMTVREIDGVTYLKEIRYYFHL